MFDGMAKIELNDYEKEVVRFLARLFDQGGNWFGLTALPRYKELGQDEAYRVIARFQNFGWIDQDSSSSWTISRTILDIAEELDHPPRKDYPKQVETWFRGKSWSVPFWLVLLGLSALVGCITVIEFILRWLGILE